LLQQVCLCCYGRAQWLAGARERLFLHDSRKPSPIDAAGSRRSVAEASVSILRVVLQILIPDVFKILFNLITAPTLQERRGNVAERCDRSGLVASDDVRRRAADFRLDLFDSLECQI
jgi:hypothetical protein